MAQRKQLSQDHKSGLSVNKCASKYHVSWDIANIWVREGQKKRPKWNDASKSGRSVKLTRSNKKSTVKFAKKNIPVPVITARINKIAVIQCIQVQFIGISATESLVLTTCL